MEKNPLNLQKGTFFILGRFSDKSGNYEITEQYAAIAKQLEAAGKKFINPLEIGDIDAKDDADKIENLKQRASYMSMCDVIVTTNDWAADEHSKSLLVMARYLGKHIAHAELLPTFLKEISDAA